MKPIRSIKFKRDPRFTPDLPSEDLAEIEEAVYCMCEVECDLREWEKRGTRKVDSDALSCFSDEFCAFWNIRKPRVLTAGCTDKENELGCRYIKSCYNFILVCGQRKGWWYLGSVDYRRTYSQANGYYGW